MSWQADRAQANSRPHAQRPLVVLKLARTGSTWLVDELQRSSLWCGIRGEVLDAIGGLNANGACDRAQTLLMDSFECKPRECARCDIEAPFAAITLAIGKGEKNSGASSPWVKRASGVWTNVRL